MSKVVAWGIRETVGISVVNLSGVTKVGLSTSVIVVPARGAPLSEPMELHAVFRPQAAELDVRWRLESGVDGVSASGGLATYDGHRWRFPAVSSIGRGGDPAYPLAGATMLEAWGVHWRTDPRREAADADPFWRQFISDSEEAWEVANVMLR